MGFFSFLVLLVIAYLLWRVTDQLPDLIFRLSEIQRDVAEMRRRLADQDATSPTAAASTSAPPVTPTTGTSSAATSPTGGARVDDAEI